MSGLLLIDNGHQKMYLPVFCTDRELAYAVLCDAMDEWSRMDRDSPWRDAVAFYEIAERLGRERTGCDGCFIGPEAVGKGEDERFVFEADFPKQRIVPVR